MQVNPQGIVAQKLAWAKDEAEEARRMEADNRREQGVSKRTMMRKGHGNR